MGGFYTFQFVYTWLFKMKSHGLRALLADTFICHILFADWRTPSLPNDLAIFQLKIPDRFSNILD